MHQFCGEIGALVAWPGCARAVVVGGAFASLWPCNVDAFVAANKCAKIGEINYSSS